MQSLARARSQITPTLHHLLSSGASAAPSCGFRTLSHAHTAFGTPLPNSHAEPSTPTPTSFPSFSPLNGHRRLQPSNHSLARFFFQQYSTERKGKPQEGTEHVSHAAKGATHVALKLDEETEGKELQITKSRQAFIGKVYGIVASQLAATVAVSSVVVFNPSIAEFILSSPVTFTNLCLASLLSLWPMHVYKNEYPLNFITLGAFTLMQSLLIGSCCAFTDGRVVLEALSTTTLAITSLTGYTFWAAERGKDFSYLRPILFPSLLATVAIGIFSIFVHPVPGIDSIAYSAFGALLFSGYLVLHTDDLIKRYKCDEYITAAINIYLGTLNLFMKVMKILSDLSK